MKRNDDIFDSAHDHDHVLILLPWYVNKTLQGDELSRVEQHVNTCALCQYQVANLEQLALAVNQSNAFKTSSQPSFARLKARLDTAHAPPSPVGLKISAPDKKRYWISTNVLALYKPGLALAAAAIFLAVVVFRVVAINQIVHNDFRTLSDAKTKTASSDSAEIRLIFKANTSQQMVEQVINNIHGYVVDGPDTQGLYIVGFKQSVDSKSIFDKLAVLRSNQNIVFAEPSYNLLSKTQAQEATP